MSGSDRETMALRISGAEELGPVRLQLPEPRDDQLLVEVRACGVCGSDLRPYRRGVQEIPFFGHEFSGTVCSVGAAIGDFRPGDRVTSGLARGCGVCTPCIRGFPNFCVQAQRAFHPGGFAERCLVSCTSGCRPLARIPDALSFVRATLHEPLSCALRIIGRARASRGDRVLVLGLGMMGLLSALLLKRQVPGLEVVGVDTHPRRVEVGIELGMDRCLVLDSRSPAPIPGEAAEFDLVIDATGAAAGFSLAVSMARLGGTVVLAGVADESLPFSPLPIFRKELTIQGAKGPYPFPNEGGGSRAVDLLLSTDLPWDRLITAYPFRLAAEGFRRAADGTALKAVLVLGE
jgi:threonine dehydrogenase-like Zn-dependent dehydrogenase